jgi:uncharacterized protein
MASNNLQTIPARRGAATIVRAGQKIKIINTSGTQVIDTWAFAIPSSTPSASSVEGAVYPNATSQSPLKYSAISNHAASAPEYMSMSHTRASLLKLVPEVGDTLRSQKRKPMVTITEDTSPGVHDTLIAACDRWRYAELGVEGYHESCTDNCWDALDKLCTDPSVSSGADDDTINGLKSLQAVLGGRVPDPLNLFMNIPVTKEGEGQKRGISFDAPVTQQGDYVILKAERNLVVVMSACPQDILDINGKNPTEAHFEVTG